MPQFIVDETTKDAERFMDKLLELSEVKQVKKVTAKPKPAKEMKPKFVGLRKRDPSIDLEGFSGMWKNNKEAKELVENAWQRKYKRPGT